MANLLHKIVDLRRSGAYLMPMQKIADRMNTISLLQLKELKFALAILSLIILASFCSPASFVTSLVRFPLRKVGVEFGDIEISILTLSIIVNQIELLPLDVPILQFIFAALFPSANARRSTKESPSDNYYPQNKIKIQRLKVRLKIKSRETFASNQISWTKRAFYLIFPRPMIVVKINRLVVEVEKAYIAPTPPADFETHFVTMSTRLPYAVSTQQHPEIPMFDQNYLLEELRNAEVLEADFTTFCLERWLQHAAVILKQNDSSDSNATVTTSDERLNSWISTIARTTFQSVSFHIDCASIIISGGGADVVKSIRQRFPPEEANFRLAKLRKEQRALTMIGASMIKISFGANAHCSNLFICFGGLQVKVGNPVQRRRRLSIPNNNMSGSDGLWEWYTVVQPFDVVAELKGVIPFVVYSLNYDHYWEERMLGLDLSVSSEISFTLCPNNLHTIFLIYFD